MESLPPDVAAALPADESPGPPEATDGPAPGPGPGQQPATDTTVGAPESRTVELLALIDRLEELLQRSSLDELEVAAGETTLVLRTPGAVAPPLDPRTFAALAAAGGDGGSASTGAAASGTATAERSEGAEDEPAEADTRHAVLAPLTGVYYSSPSPEAAPYVRVGTHVQQGQVIGLIEAMKLFNEIKSDASGSVTRLVAESGTLVKAKAPLIELETETGKRG